MSEQGTPGASAPAIPGATVIETSATDGGQRSSNAAPYVSDTSGMSASQARAMRFVDETRAELAADMDNLALRERHREALAHALRNGPEPAWLSEHTAGEAVKAAGARPFDLMRDAFEAASQPASGEQLADAVDNAAVQGVNREFAQKVAGVCAELELSNGHTRAILDRVRAHHGATSEDAPETQIARLSEAEAGEYIETAARFLGSTEKLAELSLRAREFLEARGVLKQFDESGLTMSTLAFDPKLLHTLAMAADMAGVPRGKR